MHYRVLFTGALLLVACAQKLATPASARTSASPQDTFDCVKRQLTALGYKQGSIDVDERRISATKVDSKTRRADTQFRRMLDKLDVEVAAEADGQTSIDVVGRTFGDYATHRGPTEVEEKASEQVRNDTGELLERCRS